MSGKRLGRRRRAGPCRSPASPVKALMAPRKRLPEMFSRWPRYLSHGPAVEMWSVVHLPLAFSSTGRSTKSLPSHGANGSSSWRRSLVGETFDLDAADRSAGGARKPVLAGVKPGAGSSSPTGLELRTCSPAALVSVSVMRVEVERAGQREGDDRLGRGHEGQRVGGAVVALREVAVVGGDDGVGVAVASRRAGPLADARAAGVGQHGGADGLEVGEQAVALDGGAHLLGAGRDQQRGLGR